MTLETNFRGPGFGNGGGKISSEASYIYEQSELRAKRVTGEASYGRSELRAKRVTGEASINQLEVKYDMLTYDITMWNDHY